MGFFRSSPLNWTKSAQRGQRDLKNFFSGPRKKSLRNPELSGSVYPLDGYNEHESEIRTCSF